MKENHYHGGHGKERRPRPFNGFRLLRSIPCPPWWLFVWVMALAASGCMRGRANTLPITPPLDVPAPPPRVVLPVEVEAEAPPTEPGPPPDEPRPTPAAP